jgi:ABC-type lipoprotein export system ATPase subunit
MVTHDAHIASFADRILFLKDGAILFDRKRPDGTPPGADWVTDMVREYA